MLKQINIANVASYNKVGASFTDLKEINFIYGNNGSGKSTLSNYFNCFGEDKYLKCSHDGNLELKRFIYNQKFIEENFKSGVPGIFTLGKDHIDSEQDIEELSRNIEKEQTKLDIAEGQLNNVEDDIKTNKGEFIEKIWYEKTQDNSKLKDIYNIAFKRLHGSKDRFLVEYLEKFKEKKCNVEDIDTIYSKYKVLFDEEKTEIPFIQQFDFKNNINLNIFNTVIVGGSDLYLEEFIKGLDVHDWIHEGYKVINDNELDKCPLCWQPINDEIKKRLSGFFDETYYEKKSELDENIKVYYEFNKDCTKYIEDIIIEYTDFIDENKYEKIILKIQNKHQENIKKIEEKQRAPSNKIIIDLFEEEISNLKSLNETTNEKIKAHNKLVRERSSEQKKWTDSVWDYFYSKTETEFKLYKNKINILKKTEKGLATKINNIKEEINNKKIKIQNIKDKMYGIESTIKSINSQLNIYGFNNFLLAEAENQKYKIVREDGTLANETLSEGERTFITFLYFYHLVKTNRDNKIIFIDDPISSLDSIILHIVSTLVTDLIRNKEQYKITQIFVSTHNTYFYKEITFKIDNCSFYILRKDDLKGSFVKKYKNNPITNSYEALWKELFELRNSNSSLIQNVMRRILENYFKFLGGIGLEELSGNFEEDEKLIVHSLIKWTHDGSHNISEDLYIQEQHENNQKYFSIFQQIFTKNNHEQHFKMMVENCMDINADEIFDLNLIDL